MRQVLLPFLLVLSVFPLVAEAQTALRRPLSAVPADSVHLWDNGAMNWRRVTQHMLPSLLAQPFKAEARAFKSLRKAVAQRAVTVTGGCAPLLNAEEGYQAAQTVMNGGQLFLLTGDGALLDAPEAALHNALPYALRRPDISPMDKGVAAQALLNAVGLIYATGDRTVYANFYLNSFVRLRLDTLSLTIDQVTQMPYLPDSKFRIGGLPQGSHRFALRLRLPAWAESEAVKLFVNGHEEDLRIEQGYLVIDRPWNNNDEAYISFPETLRQVSAEGAPAFALGPLLFAPRKRGATFPSLSDLELSEDDASALRLSANGWEFVPLQEATAAVRF